MKKFRRSPIAVICYVMAAITAAYFIAVIFSTMSTIHQYYAQYQMSAGFGETLGYLLQNGLSPLVSAITLFMAGFILEEVRKLNPSNWMTEEELAEAKEAKKMAREAKIIARGEAAKAKADAAAEAEAAERAAEAEKKADEMAAAEFSAVVAEGYDDEEDAEVAAVEVIEEEPAEADAEPEAADADEEAAAADVEEESEPAEEAQFSVVIEEDDTAEDAAEEAPEDKETEEAAEDKGTEETPEDKGTEEAPESKDTKKKRKRNKRRN